MEEVWKTIKKYKDYQISNFGNVKSLRWGNRITILRPRDNKYGYLGVNLYRDGEKRKRVKIHRLVAEEFLRKLQTLKLRFKEIKKIIMQIIWSGRQNQKI